ncbi:hypothetical protein [Providencia sp. PROV033]|uniref:hypothetical protein n=1 Tax=Providencia sp. PROV033 TaxID=2949765 RepID=UPI00234B7790|nr:hypothetical protein [Providencia sp. PROV033]
MQDLMPPINTQDSIFHDGDPTTGQLGTIVTALWLNNVQAATRDVQAEIKNVLAKAGMTPDPKKNNQLADAISQIVSSGNYASTAYVDNGLNKKIDKANISGVKGNDNDKVPSLNLFTTEIGKLQPKGNYQPAGDYATNAALTTGLAGKQPVGDYATNTALANGLNQKLNTSSVVQETGTSTTQVMSQDASTKLFMKLGDYGFGGNGGYKGDGTDAGFLNIVAEQKSQICTTDKFTTWQYRYSPTFIMNAGECWSSISINYLDGRVIIGAGEVNRASFVNELHGTANTITDRNGYLRSKSFVGTETQGVPIGGSILWNSASPIPENFWPNEGRSFSASEYPELAKIFPELKLPDDRGYAIRIADNGKNIDPGRTVGTYQDDAIRNITGGLLGVAHGTAWYGGTGAFSKTKGYGTGNAGGGGISHEVIFDASDSVPTANENRMKNVSKILITRVK